MADEDTHECGIGGVGLNPPQGDRVVEMYAGPGQSPLDPTSANYKSDPELAFGVSSLKFLDAPLGQRGVTFGRVYNNLENDGRVRLLLPGLPPEEFTSFEELHNWTATRGLAIEPSTHEIAQHDYVSGFLNAQSFREASPAMRQLAVGLTRIFGNNEFAADALHAFRTSENAAHIDELTARLRRWSSLSREEKMEAIEALPDPVYGRTIAGRLLNAQRNLATSMFSVESVVHEALRRYGSTAADYEMGQLEEARLRSGVAGIANPASAAGRMFNEFLDTLKTDEARGLNITPDLVSTHMLFKSHPMRRHVVEKNAEAAWNNSHGNMVVRARYNTENPTGFEYTDADGRKLVGQRALDAYEASLTDRQKEWLDQASEFLKAASARTNEALFEAGLISNDELKYRLYEDPYWVPLIDMNVNRTSATFTTEPVGRRTMAEGTLNTYFSWVDSSHRAAAINHYHRQYMRLIRNYGLDDTFEVNRHKVSATSGEESRWTNMSDDTGIFVYEPQEDGSQAVHHIGFTDNFSGRMAKELLAPGAGRNRVRGTRVSDTLDLARRFMRFTSVMYTLGKLTWWPKTMAMNIGIAPVAMESAFGLRPGEAGSMMAAYLRNLPRAMRGMWTTKNHVDKDWIDFFRERGAGSPIDERMRPISVQGHIQAQLVRATDLLGRDTALNAATGYVKKGFEKFLHFQHSPDLMTQAAAFRTFLEHRTGRVFSDINEMRNFAADPRNSALIAQAENGSRRVLPNFTQHGGGAAIGWLREFFPFFNATLQTFPYARQIFNSRSGKIAGASAILAGYLMREMYAEETGDTKSTLNGEDGSIYFGDGFSIPADYVLHPLLKMGANMYHIANGNMGVKDALFDRKDGMVHSFLDTFSPIVPPSDSHGQPQWWLMNVTPPLAHLPILFLGSKDQYGNDIMSDHAVDANNNELLDAANWQFGTPASDLLSTQTAKAISTLTGGLVDMAPGRWSALFHTVLPVLPDTVNAMTGERAARSGREGTIGERVMDAVAPLFEGQQPDLYGARTSFDSMVRERVRGAVPNGQPVTMKNLLAGHNPTAIKAARLQERAQQIAQTLTINGMTHAEINRAIPLATQAGDATSRDALLLMRQEWQVKMNAAYQNLIEQLPER